MEPKIRWAFLEQRVEAPGLLAHGWEWCDGKGEIAVLGRKSNKSGAIAGSAWPLVAVSFVGLALVPLLVLQSNLVDYEVSFRHGLAGALYGAVCILGILAAFFPAKCKGVFQKTQNPLHLANSGSLKMSGHHPDCTNFAGNRIRLWGREFCAACSGLLVGAGIALVGCVSQFFVDLNLVGGSVWMLLLGEFGLFLGLVQIKLAGYSKVFANGVFVVGSFITLAEADVLAGSTSVDLFVLGLIVFLLWLRIMLSERNNRRICQMCRSCL